RRKLTGQADARSAASPRGLPAGLSFSRPKNACTRPGSCSSLYITRRGRSAPAPPRRNGGHYTMSGHPNRFRMLTRMAVAILALGLVAVSAPAQELADVKNDLKAVRDTLTR